MAMMVVKKGRFSILHQCDCFRIIDPSEFGEAVDEQIPIFYTQKQVEASGWKYIKGKWFCPDCDIRPEKGGD